jgi:APA family basic amino acid/polyamine antiporter
VLMAAPRVYFAMARDGIFFASFGVVDPRSQIPARATAVQATLAVALALTGSFDQILSYFMVPTLVFLALTVTGVFVLHRRHPGERSLAPPGYPVSPLLFLVPILAVILLQTARDPVRSSIGLLVVLMGIPFAGWVLSGRRSAVNTAPADLVTETINSDSTLDDPSAVPSIGTQS